MLTSAVGYALAAAGSFALATALQHSRARHHTEAARDGRLKRWIPVLAAMGPLMRDRVWQLGWVVNGLGFGFHAAALNHGPIAVVQAILVVQLLLAIVIADVRRHTLPSRRDALAALAVVAGVALVVVQRADAGRRVVDGVPTMIFLAVGTTVVLALVGVARLTHGRSRGLLIGIATGVCFTGTATNLTLLTSRVSDLGWPGMLHWSLGAVILTSGAGTILAQDALASGELAPPLTAMTVTDPLVGLVAGALLFDAVSPSEFQMFVGLPAAAVLIVIGVGVLAASPAAKDEIGQAAADDDTSDRWRVRNLRTVSDHG